MMNAELTAENRPACESSVRFYVQNGHQITHRDGGGVQVFVVFPHDVLSVKHIRFLGIYGKKVGVSLSFSMARRTLSGQNRG